MTVKLASFLYNTIHCTADKTVCMQTCVCSAGAKTVSSMFIQRKQVHGRTHWLDLQNTDSSYLLYNCLCSVRWELVGHRAQQWEQRCWMQQLSEKTYCLNKNSSLASLDAFCVQDFCVLSQWEFHEDTLRFFKYYLMLSALNLTSFWLAKKSF